MEINNEKLVVYRGEQFSRLVGGVEWDAADQIVLCLFRNGGTKKYFVKVADVKYPDAVLLTKSDDPEFQLRCFFSTEFTNSLTKGTYYMEAMVMVAGVLAPVQKATEEFFIIKDSQIDDTTTEI